MDAANNRYDAIGRRGGCLIAWRVLSVGTNHGGPGAFKALRRAEDDAVELSAWFGEAFGRHRPSPLIDCKPLSSPTRGELIEKLADCISEASPGDRCVVYWAGHSTDDGLVLRDRDVLSVAELAKTVVDSHRGAEILWILDVCDGGHIAGQIRDLLGQKVEPSCTFVTLGDPDSRATWDGAFWKALQRTLASGVALDGGIDTTSPFVPLDAVLDAVRDGAVHVDIIPGSASWELPNPHWDLPPLPFVSHAAFENLHPKTWVGLSGREREVAQLTAWATAGCETQPIAIVTAGPGSGKSSVLYHIATEADLERRVAAAASCRQVSVEALTESIGAMFGWKPDSVSDLVALLRGLETPPLILLDGLDEAIAPADVGSMIRDLVDPRDGGPAAHILVASRESGLEATGLRSESHAMVVDLDVDPGSVADAIEDHVHRRIEKWREKLPKAGRFSVTRESAQDAAIVRDAAASIAEWAGVTFLLAEEILGTVLDDCKRRAASLRNALDPWRRDENRHWDMHEAHMKAVEMRVEWMLDDPQDNRGREIFGAATETLFQVLAWSLGESGMTRPPLFDVYRHLWPIVASKMGLDREQVALMTAPFNDAWALVGDYRTESSLVVDHLGRTAPAFRLSHAVYADIHRSWLIGAVEDLGYGDAEGDAERYVNSAILDGLLAGVAR